MMKMKVEVKEVDGEGLLALIGKRVTLMCMNFFYTGDLVGVNDTCVKLENPAVVFDTGAFGDKEWSDAQELPNDWYVQISSIESFGVLK
jgi:hypothetical protein